MSFMEQSIDLDQALEILGRLQHGVAGPGELNAGRVGEHHGPARRGKVT